MTDKTERRERAGAIAYLILFAAMIAFVFVYVAGTFLALW